MGKRPIPDSRPPALPSDGDPLLDSMLSGRVEVVRGALQRDGLLDLLTGDVFDHIRALFGEDKRDRIADTGLDRLHRFLDIQEILALQQRVEADWWRRWRRLCPLVAAAIFGDRPVRLGARVWFRAIPPTAVTDPYAKTLEYFSGKIGPASAHRDTWAGLPNNAISVWAAMTDCLAEHGLFYHPGCWARSIDRKATDFDKLTDRERICDVAAGDAVLFSTHHLHGSLPNHIDRTRVTISIRIAVGAPHYGAGHSAWFPFVEARHIGKPMETVRTLQCMASPIFPKWVATAPRRRRRTARYSNRLRAKCRAAQDAGETRADP